MLSNQNPGLSSIQIAVNGEVISGGEEVSLYSQGEGSQKQRIFQCIGMEYGKHTIEITLLDLKNQEGNGPKASIDAFRIFRDYDISQEPEVPSSVDSMSLKLAISMADKMKLQQVEYGSYTVESWQVVQEALDNAKIVLNNADISQEEIDSAFLRLITACNLLEEGTQKAGLKAVIEGTKEILANADSLRKYTVESVGAVRVALAQAVLVYDNISVDQGTINEAAFNLMTAVTSLLVKEEETRLDILIQKADELLGREAQYTPSSIQTLKAALIAAKMVNQDGQSTTEQTQEAYASLARAMTELVRRADRSELVNVLVKGEEILSQADRYVQSTLENLPEVMKEAQAVYDDLDADNKAVGEILKKLVNEILRARLFGDVDGNGAVETADAAAILSWMAELSQLTEDGKEAADVNHDNIADGSDASQILQYMAQKIIDFKKVDL